MIKINQQGVTLLEILTAVAISSVSLCGLAVAFMYGLKSWDEGMMRLHMQQNGSYAVAEIQNALCKANMLVALHSGLIIVNLPASPVSQDKGYQIEFSVRENKLYKKQVNLSNAHVEEFILLPYDHENDSLRVENFSLMQTGSLLKGELIVAAGNKNVDIGHKMTFDISAVMRNSDFASQSGIDQYAN